VNMFASLDKRSINLLHINANLASKYGPMSPGVAASISAF
jgi:hypothetical protein